MKVLKLTTTITLPDKDEHFIYKYLEQNGYGQQVKEAKNRGGFDFKQSSQGITVETSCDITDAPNKEPSKIAER